MTEFITVEESYVKALVEDAAWDIAKVPLHERGGKKGDKPAKGKKGDKPDFTTDARKGDKSKTKPGEEDFEGEEMKEAVEVHECPLCESVLEEELSDDVIFEHVSQIQTALKALEEASDEEEEEVEEDTSDAPVSKRDKMLAKIQTMKKGK
jgi:hypothetical protein